MIKQGDIVCSVYGIVGNIAYLYGYGTYKGSEDISSNIVIGKALVELDSGENLIDLESLWGLPETLDKYLANKDIVFIDPKEVRKTNNIYDWKSSGIVDVKWFGTN